MGETCEWGMTSNVWVKPIACGKPAKAIVVQYGHEPMSVCGIHRRTALRYGWELDQHQEAPR